MAKAKRQILAASAIEPPFGGNVMLLDDDPEYCALVRAVLKNSSRFSLVGSYSNPFEAIEAVPSIRPNIALVDLKLPEMSGIEWIQRIRTQYPHVRMLLVTGFIQNLSEKDRAIVAQANGCLTKPFLGGELLAALEVVNLGGTVWSASAKAFLHSNHHDGTRAPFDSHLSPRECAVMVCLMKNETDKEIATHLQIGVSTVHTLLRRIFRKLGVHSRDAAVKRIGGNADAAMYPDCTPFFSLRLPKSGTKHSS